ncbi:MAG: hypothetical protein IJX98_05475 [Clostridia bacterium]|nr:hypothetical protein [Clostridia bacterium]
MIKKSFMYFLIGAGICAGLALLVLLCSVIMRESKLLTSALPLCIACACIGLLLGLIFGGIGEDWKSMKWRKNESFFVSSDKPVIMGKLFLIVLPIFILGGLLGLIFAVNYQGLDGKLYQCSVDPEFMASLSSDDYLYGICLPIGWLSCSCVFFLFYGLKILLKHKKYQCKKCGSMLPWIYKTTLKTDSGTYTKSKEVDTYGKVGTVYIDGQEVGEVRGKTGSYTKNYNTKWWNERILCECKFCKNEKEFFFHEESPTTISYS